MFGKNRSEIGMETGNHSQTGAIDN
jgi:hypothetical protein